MSTPSSLLVMLSRQRIRFRGPSIHRPRTSACASLSRPMTSLRVTFSKSLSWSETIEGHLWISRLLRITMVAKARYKPFNSPNSSFNSSNNSKPLLLSMSMDHPSAPTISTNSMKTSLPMTSSVDSVKVVVGRQTATLTAMWSQREPGLKMGLRMRLRNKLILILSSSRDRMTTTKSLPSRCKSKRKRSSARRMRWRELIFCRSRKSKEICKI